MGGDEYVNMNIIQSLLEVQANAFKASFRVLFEELKEEIKTVRKDVVELQTSLSFSQGQLDTSLSRLDNIDNKVRCHERNLNDVNGNLDGIDSELEYMENQNRRNNVKIIGVPENKTTEKSWDDTEKMVKQLIKDKLEIQEDVEIERCHRINHKNKGNGAGNRRNQSGGEQPRNIVAKFSSWKVKENILKKARAIRPANLKFVADFSQRTLDKRAAQVPDLLQARANGKIAYFIMDRLIVKDKPPDNRSVPRQGSASSDAEVTFRDS